MPNSSLRLRQLVRIHCIAALGAIIAFVASPTDRTARADDAPPAAEGDANRKSERATLPAGTRVIITEIMYNPASDEARGESEWVEIANLGTVAIEIVDWRLDDEDTRPADQWGPFSCTLLPGQVAVLINGDHVTEEEFRSAWDHPDSGDAMPYLVIPVKWGSLANTPSATNEILVLRDTDDRIVCEVNFETGRGWPRITGIGGPSIYLTDLDATDLNVGSIWKASTEGEDGARLVRPTPIFNGADVGSPGRLPARRPAAVEASPKESTPKAS